MKPYTVLTTQNAFQSGQLLFVTSDTSKHKGELAVFSMNTKNSVVTDIIRVYPATVMFDEKRQTWDIEIGEKFYNLRNDSVKPATQFDIARTLTDKLLQKIIHEDALEPLQNLVK